MGTRSFCFAYDGKSTWANGVRVCAMYNAEIPLPLNAQEDVDYFNFITTKLGLTSSWLDGNNNNAHGIWLDSKGNNITYFNWEQGQPNGASVLHYRPNTGGKWNDHYNTYVENIVCQKTPFCKFLITV